MKKNDSLDTKSIVNISSIVRRNRRNPFQAHYSASKGGIRLPSKGSASLYCAQADFPGGKIRINSVHPGGVATPLAANVAHHKMNEGVSFLTKYAYSIGMMATPDQLVSAIAFLASNDASFVTGTELIVDGGWTAQ
ncbi:NAD(P)-binding protein [Gonapodya prolifera JEL478]|uniref:NAD(P)-binding protein n=1 Tax=Gonapodya prolifera (strain JEL478) TaxID=1344416 RepID=A0A139AI32_GONPJ|nr:NAD(P)-binding protein [Gonapodya prolifera JEL478]|eukprot:KXS16359.1 NAD(P)-binding protein [Gonapodya prolifera JEL478]